MPSWITSLFKRKKKPPTTLADDWLKRSTDRDTVQWLNYIQDAIAANSKPSKDPNHDTTDTLSWVYEVAEEVLSSRPTHNDPLPWKLPKPYDGNMHMASTLGLVLCAWYASVHRAKISDPRRPIEGRQKAHQQRARWIGALVSAITDNQHDPEVFKQQFENPFADDATDGDFI